MITVKQFENDYGNITLEKSGDLWSVYYTGSLTYGGEAVIASLVFKALVQELKLQEIEDRVNRLYEMFKEQEKE